MYFDSSVNRLTGIFTKSSVLLSVCYCECILIEWAYLSKILVIIWPATSPLSSPPNKKMSIPATFPTSNAHDAPVLFSTLRLLLFPHLFRRLVAQVQFAYTSWQRRSPCRQHANANESQSSHSRQKPTMNSISGFCLCIPLYIRFMSATRMPKID